MATYARSGGIAYNQFTANLPGNLPVKHLVNWLRSDRIMVTSLCVPTFLRPRVYKSAVYALGLRLSEGVDDD